MSGDRRQMILIAAITALFVAFLAWANATVLDLVTRGQGRVVALGQNRSVQVPSRGTILRFEAKVGDRVEEGDVIAVVNPTEVIGQLTETEARLRTLQFRLDRLNRELSGDGFEPGTPEGGVATQAPDDPLFRAEVELLEARRDDLVARVSSLTQARLQIERELEGVIAEIAGNSRARDLLAEEAAQILPLVEAGTLGVSERFRIDRETATLETSAKVLGERQAQLSFAIGQKVAEIEAARTAFLNEILAERAEVLGQLAELSERLPALRQRVDQTEIVAPVGGIVNQVFFNSPGSVVSEGEIVAELVPTKGALEVEAMVAPEDIANVEPGQTARIALTAYDATRYGTITGRVLRVSADASFREETQSRMFIVATSLDDTLTEADGSPVTVLPGMIAQVDIVRGKRTVLEYFWNPVAKVRDRAFRE